MDQDDLSLCLSCDICYSCPQIPSLLLQHLWGLWKGDPITPRLCFLALKMLKRVIARAAGGFLIWFPAVKRIKISHFFIDDPLIFYLRYTTELSYLSFWFFALRCFWIKNNLGLSELVWAGDDLAGVLGCKLSSLPMPNFLCSCNYDLWFRQFRIWWLNKSGHVRNCVYQKGSGFLF